MLQNLREDQLGISLANLKTKIKRNQERKLVIRSRGMKEVTKVLVGRSEERERKRERERMEGNRGGLFLVTIQFMLCTILCFRIQILLNFTIESFHHCHCVYVL